VINQSIVPVEWSLHLNIGVVYPLFVSKVNFFELSTLFIKHYVLILPLFVVICRFDFLGSHMACIWFCP
jgi:hypothetical protein